MEGFNYQQIKDLQQLISSVNNDSDSESEDDIPKQHLSRQQFAYERAKNEVQVNAGGVAAATTAATAAGGKSDRPSGPTGPRHLENSDIWDSAEVEEIGDSLRAEEEPRQIPKYQMKFKQAVGTEDIFLGMSLKSPASASCEWLTLTVQLPDESRQKIQLSVQSDLVDLRTPKYRLQLPTPFPVDPNGSSAKWHSDSDCLEVTLKLSRELDDVNF